MATVAAGDEPVLAWRVAQAEKAIEKKADQADVDRLVAELVSIKKLLGGVLFAIVGGSIGFGYAAIQIASSIHG